MCLLHKDVSLSLPLCLPLLKKKMIKLTTERTLHTYMRVSRGAQMRPFLQDKASSGEAVLAEMEELLGSREESVKSLEKGG